MCSPIRWRDGVHWHSLNPPAESPGPHRDVGLPAARAGSDHVGTSSLCKVGGRAVCGGEGQCQEVLCLLQQNELIRSGLPLCDVVINLAGENILNPLRRSAGP